MTVSRANVDVHTVRFLCILYSVQTRLIRYPFWSAEGSYFYLFIYL